jgi:hypothetical protein
MVKVAEERPVGFHRVRFLSFALEDFPKVEVRQFDLEEIYVVRDSLERGECNIGQNFGLQPLFFQIPTS